MSCSEADKREESSIPALLPHHSKGTRRLQESARLFRQVFRNAARAKWPVAFPTGRVLPDDRRGSHMAGVKPWLWRQEIRSVETGNREKVAQKRRRGEPDWWAEGGHFLKERQRNVVMDASDQRKPHLKTQADLSHQRPHGCAENHEDSTADHTRQSIGSVGNVGNAALYLSSRTAITSSMMHAGIAGESAAASGPPRSILASPNPRSHPASSHLGSDRTTTPLLPTLRETTREERASLSASALTGEPGRVRVNNVWRRV